MEVKLYLFLLLLIQITKTVTIQTYSDRFGSIQQDEVVINNCKYYKCIVAEWCNQAHNEPGTSLEHWWTAAWDEVQGEQIEDCSNEESEEEGNEGGNEEGNEESNEESNEEDNEENNEGDNNGGNNGGNEEGNEENNEGDNEEGNEGDNNGGNNGGNEENNQNLTFESNCSNTTPLNPDNFRSSSDGYWGGYSKGAFVLHNTNVYQVSDNTWWTSEIPGQSTDWTKCEPLYLGNALFSLNSESVALLADNSIIIDLGIKKYTISSFPFNIELPGGNYQIKIPNVINVKDNYKLVISSDIESFEISNEILSQEIVLSLSQENIQNIEFNINLDISTINGLESVNATINNLIENTKTVLTLVSGNNSVLISEAGQFIVSVPKFILNNKNIVCNSIKINNGQITNSNIKCIEKSPNQILGYYTSWNATLTIEEAVNKGYTAIALAFYDVTPTEVKPNQDFLIYADWSQGGNTERNMANEIKELKESGKLEYALISVGGELNTFKPGTASASSIALMVVNYIKKYGYDGIDLDLEHLGNAIQAEDPEEYIFEFTTELRLLMPEIIITCAPQMNLLSNSTVGLVNTGTEIIYNKSIANGMFDIVNLQAYNTGGYCFGPNSSTDIYDIFTEGCDAPGVNLINQYNIKFVKEAFLYMHSFLVPSSTLILIGLPSIKEAAGRATIFNGPFPNIYQEICKAYNDPDLIIHPQFGGAMTWSINQDEMGGFKFIDAVLSSDCSNV